MKRGRDRKAGEALAERKNYSEEKNKRERIYSRGEKQERKNLPRGEKQTQDERCRQKQGLWKTLTAEYGNTINGEEKEELNDKSLMNRAAILRADDRHASRGLYYEGKEVEATI